MRSVPAMMAAMALLTAPTAGAVDHADYDALLDRYVVESADGVNRIRYGAWRANARDRAALDAYVARMQREQPSGLPRADRFAYWVNLYNSVTLQIVLENYPISSIRNIRSRTLDPRGLIGPWRTERVTVEGRRLTLDDIEHSILRREFGEPRVHYAVNCASIGCPNLMRRAWRGETLEADLSAAARAYVNNPRGVAVDTQGRVRASSIYQWFARDFGGERGALAHMRAYAWSALEQRLRGAAHITGYAYDWTLNDAQ